MMHRRRFLITASATLAWPATAHAQGAAPAIRNMLVTATRLATERLGRRDGFFGDSIVRIPLPGLLGRTQDRLEPIGLSGPLDDLEMRMNRAAEAVMPQARDLVVSAIRSMTISDGISILRGPDTAATQYLRGRTETSLTRLLRPPMESTLASSGAYGALDQAAGLVDTRSSLGQLFGGRGSRGAAQDFRGEVTDFAVEKALDGIFHYVGEEERGLRRNPTNRTRDILRGLFGQ
ncbi:DUF4197 domain-containing protein [Hyphobacterium sp. HN65]|uniref:DUF4197 domain-containing protein n=1 Tax=Hyphobacterium lacteum TaxID=3116575 RepID=A0ABU7LNI8_9PROT|nr:DUF4197 domain-containing protein [Hyphobacterium sp. HN65]MEE2525447.1 DUF4197 domain-containing protein [Hyphobacterium sp. HN65]